MDSGQLEFRDRGKSNNLDVWEEAFGKILRRKSLFKKIIFTVLILV